MRVKTKSIEVCLSQVPDLDDVEDAFWDLVDKTAPDRCWEWLGRRNAGGYGMFSVKDNNLMAHRLMFYLARAIDPVAEFVCHTCDNPWCVNPNHLFLGSHRDNMHDAWKKGKLGGSLSPLFHLI